MPGSVTLPKEDSPVLIWQNDSPHFKASSNSGDRLILFFGETNFDDFWLPETLFIICLQRRGSEWTVEMESMSAYGRCDQQSKVDDLVAELNRCIQMRNPFDLAKYVSGWKRQDPHFDFNILWNDDFQRLISRARVQNAPNSSSIDPESS